MNIYFFQGIYIQREKQKALIESLKVHEVMSCFNTKEARIEIDDSIKSLVSAEYSYGDDIEYQDAYSKIVYGFVNRIRTPLFVQGDMVDVAIGDLYKDSRCCQPYANLRRSNDPNIMILHNNESLPTDVSRFILNILNKQTGDTRFQERIAFVKLSEFITPIHFPKIRVHYENSCYNNFSWSSHPRLRDKNNPYKTYDAIETIVKQNSKEFRFLEPDKYISLFSYFINEAGHQYYDTLKANEEEEWETQRSRDEMMWDAMDQAREDERENFWWTHGYYPSSNSDDDY